MLPDAGALAGVSSSKSTWISEAREGRIDEREPKQFNRDLG
jgi:hypothetical protein